MWKELKKLKKSKVFAAMSGGVDSSVAAALLKKQGHDVVGVFMKFWYDADSSGHKENRCCSLEARQDAMRVCAKLNIPFLTWDFQKEFKGAVVDDFISGYKKGITPNPCVVCNKEIKFGLFLEKALKMGADYAATGHYARIKNYELRIKNNKNPLFIIHNSLFIAKDKNKDQSYFLWTLNQKQLKHCLFPIGDYTKEEVRTLAKKYRLPVAFKKESQEICFAQDMRRFLKTRIYAERGAVVELKTGRKIGEHQGVQFYTIGQKAPVGGAGPYYVAAKNLRNNQLIVVKKNDKDLISRDVFLKRVNWIIGKPLKFPLKILVRTRYRQPLTEASIKYQASSIKLIFNKPAKFVAPGQSAVFYGKKGELLGGGVII